MAEPLYMKDSYVKEFDAVVKSVSGDGEKQGKFIVLDQTAFYYKGGGQPWDEGILKRESDGEEFKVVFVGKFGGEISHEVDKPGLKVGDKVHCILDWERRYKLMRMHTSAHVISGFFHKDYGAKITGNQVDLDKTRIDFDIENFDRSIMEECVAKSNALIDKDLPVKIDSLSREEAEQNPDLARLAKGLPEGVQTIRTVEIVGFDKQADGGTHVKSLKGVGHLELIKCENKGKSRRRVYYKLVD